MLVIKCKDCQRRRTVGGDLPPGAHPIAVAVFAFLDWCDLTVTGWSRGDDGRWRCSRCTGRRRMLRAVPPIIADAIIESEEEAANDVTDGEAPKRN